MTKEVRTREAGKSAGQVMIGVHATFALPYVVGLQRLGLNRGRAMARIGPASGKSRFGPQNG